MGQLASSQATVPLQILSRVNDLRDLSTRAHLFDDDGDDLGFSHLPRQVGSGDLAAVDGATFRVVNVIDGLPGPAIDALVMVEPVRLAVVA
jgi:hypothetical protein